MPVRPKSRAARGERAGAAKLNEESVRLIIASDAPNGVLAARFGVSSVAVSNIRLGKTWRHISGLNYTGPSIERMREDADGRLVPRHAREKAIEIDGVKYPSMRDAINALGLKSYQHLYRFLKNREA